MSRAANLLLVAAACTACSGRMPILDPGGPQAARIATYWWITFWLSALVLAAVVAFLLHTLAHRRVVEAPASLTEEARAERRLALGVAAAVGLTTLTLVVLLVTSIATGRALHRFGGAEALTVEVTGYQWWWDVEYWDPVPSRRVRTANEIHIPVGRPVLVKTRSLDVIHSFWVPGLHGKKDHVPGHGSSLVLQADHAGTFAGRCAEFCGVQHAHMQLLVIAEPPEVFEAWLQAQRESAVAPTDPFARHGFDLFVTGPCALCHTVLGTAAGGRRGPDLTHLASRRTLAAGTLPNTPGHLAGWIVDPQGVKPGAQMPGNSFGADDLNALLAFLGGLR
jgi:cytochrome c oxidase subunit 2